MLSAKAELIYQQNYLKFKLILRKAWTALTEFKIYYSLKDVYWKI